MQMSQTSEEAAFLTSQFFITDVMAKVKEEGCRQLHAFRKHSGVALCRQLEALPAALLLKGTHRGRHLDCMYELVQQFIEWFEARNL